MYETIALPEPGHEMRLAEGSSSLAVMSTPVACEIYRDGRLIDAYFLIVMGWDVFVALNARNAHQDYYDKASWTLVVTAEDLSLAKFW